MDDQALQELIDSLPDGVVATEPDTVEKYRFDRSQDSGAGTPAAVVRAEDAGQVQTAVRWAASHHVPVVPRGAGSGLSGGSSAVDGGLVLSLERMRAVEIDTDCQVAVVEPGAFNAEVKAAAAEHGLWYPPDPASAPWSTIGGNVATNAGGLCCVKYGVTRDYVLGLEAVVGRGDVVRLGRRTAKGVAGYDLAGLMVGSEGTLGIITEITVRLRGTRAAERTVVGYFDSLVAAGEAVAAVASAGIVPSALELIDRHCLRAVDEWRNMGLADGGDVLLLGRCDAPGQAGEEEADAMVGCFESAGATWTTRSTDAEEAEALFAARRLAYPAVERLGPVLTEDICVPKMLVPEMLARIERIAGEYDIHIANVAHAGDGNLHPLMITPADDDAARVRAQAAFERIVDEAIAIGGTVTGEHGVGLLKRRGLEDEAGPVVLDMHRAIKRALDPAGIFNPGKVFAVDGPLNAQA
jgi:glycolate oxidase